MNKEDKELLPGQEGTIETTVSEKNEMLSSFLDKFLEDCEELYRLVQQDVERVKMNDYM